ncbi:MAG TPA: transposase [Caulobacteraceae bacterium]|nr:transposase [Caulobacteraceae bacterium]
MADAYVEERAGSPRSGPVGWNSRGYLPHFDAGRGVQHIVFRLADALPAAVLSRLEKSPAKERVGAAEAALDAGLGSRVLGDPRIAAMICDALRYFDARRYRLEAWCVMPTHVHVLVEQTPGWPLAAVVHGWKSFTGNRANEILGRRGRFWSPDYFDRIIRGEPDFEATRRYIEENPATAGLCAEPAAWRWSSAGANGARASSPL